MARGHPGCRRDRVRRFCGQVKTTTLRDPSPTATDIIPLPQGLDVLSLEAAYLTGTDGDGNDGGRRTKKRSHLSTFLGLTPWQMGVNQIVRDLPGKQPPPPPSSQATPQVPHPRE